MIYIVRHAESQYNADQIQHVHGQPWQEDLNIKCSKNYVDCSLSQKGIQQCLNSKEEILSKNIDIVLVSPMKRAIQTAHEIFKDDQFIQYQVIPIICEGIQSSCDISDYRNTKSYFQDLLQQNQLLFDDSFDELWQLRVLEDQNLVNQIQEQINQGNNFQDICLKMIKDFYPKHLEYYNILYKRVQKFKMFLKKFVLDNPQKNIAIFGHSLFFYYLQATQFDSNFYPCDGTWMKNVEIRKINI